MENLARIISHGFAVVVVLLLGIGFIYRGELFPELELPDFLVPESGKTADAGATSDQTRTESEVTRQVVAGTAIEPASSASPSIPTATTETTARESGAATPAATMAPAQEGNQVVEGAAVAPVPRQEEDTVVVTEAAVEVAQAPANETTPASVAEAPVTAEAEVGDESEAGRSAFPESVPKEDSSGESVVEPSVVVPAPDTTVQTDKLTAESPITPRIVREPGPQSGAQIPAVGEQATTSETASDVTQEPREPNAVTGAEISPSEVETGPSSAKSASEVKPYELLAAAREAFWLHNYEDAEKNYRALTELEPENPDGYGELGNMYFSQGRWDEAAAEYYEAGIRLVSEGRLDAARELVNVIRGLNGKQADDLDKLISSAATTGTN